MQKRKGPIIGALDARAGSLWHLLLAKQFLGTVVNIEVDQSAWRRITTDILGRTRDTGARLDCSLLCWPEISSLLIGQTPTLLRSHWSRASEC